MSSARPFCTRIFILTLLGGLWSGLASATRNEDAGMNRFVSGLLHKMTLEEKIGQLVQYTADMAVTGSSVRENYRKDIEGGNVGSIFNAYGPKFTRELQQIAIEHSRLKIPMLFGYDVIHGHRTTFPIPLGESSSWDLALMENTARVAAREAAADGVHWAFGPMVDVSREPRWGRIMEGAGEDPWLGAKIAVARVHGLQGQLGDTEHVLACVKHFAGYGAPIAGREYNTADMSERELRETILPPFKAAVDAGAATFMTAINEVNGTPGTSNRWLLTDLLRKQWKFKGFVVSDYTTINELVPHGVAADEKEAAALALHAGTDMDMQGAVYATHLRELVKTKRITMGEIDASARRVLEAKYRLGLFRDPYRFSDEKRAEAELMKPENIAVAREAARKSIVLLKNDNAVLPIKRGKTIALIGPLADDQRNQIGNWSAAGDWHKVITLRDGLAKVGGDKNKILYARGSNLLEEDTLIDFLNVHGDGQITKDRRPPAEMIREAVAVARRADVVVVALGETQNMSGEATSRTRIRLPENQQDLLRALKGAGKPIVLVLFNGRPLALEGENFVSDAMVETWFLGHQAGTAIADVLYGDYNPSGRLTVSFPRNEGQIPIYYAQKSTGRPHAPNEQYGFKDYRYKFTSRYLDTPNAPLFPFGYGLSYANFEYSAPKLSAAEVRPGQALTVSVTVKNTSEVEGEETVQMYVQDVVASVTRPVQLLRGFKKVTLKPGESRTVELPLTTEDLKFYNADMKWVAERGEFKVLVGRNSAETQEASFKLK